MLPRYIYGFFLPVRSWVELIREKVRLPPAVLEKNVLLVHQNISVSFPPSLSVNAETGSTLYLSYCQQIT